MKAITTSSAAKTAAECRQYLACWAEQHASAAEVRCTSAIERRARQYDVEWTNSRPHPTFSQYRWKDQAKGTVTYMGDPIKFQNGVGAWTHYTYECDVDPLDAVPFDSVHDVRVSAGRLP
jgi:hypothetical protein